MAAIISKKNFPSFQSLSMTLIEQLAQFSMFPFKDMSCNHGSLRKAVVKPLDFLRRLHTCAIISSWGLDWSVISCRGSDMAILQLVCLTK